MINDIYLDQRRDKSKFHKILIIIYNNAFFQTFINISIIINTIILALDKFDDNENTIETFDKVNLSFYFIFLIEMLLKLIALGFKLYFKDSFNTFDAIIVLVSSVDVILTNYSFNSSISGSRAFQALRTFRLIRVFKLAKSWKSF